MLTIPVPGLSLEQQPPDLLMAIALWGEARGEGPLGMLGVGRVIVHRAYGPDCLLPDVFQADGGKAVKKVILRPWQFSCFNLNDPNRDKLLTPHKHEPEAWGLAVAVSTLILHGNTGDPTHGALNYLTKDLYDSDKAPEWARAMRVTAEIGRHVFGVA